MKLQKKRKTKQSRCLAREFAVLESIPDSYSKYVVSMDEIDRGRNEIINIVYIFKPKNYLTMGPDIQVG